MDENRLYLGIDYGGNAVKLGLVDSYGNLQGKTSWPTVDLTEKADCRTFSMKANDFVHGLGVYSSELGGVGLAIPGFVAQESYYVANVEVDWPLLLDCLQHAFPKIPVRILGYEYNWNLLGYEISDVKYIGLAETLGIGSSNLDSCKISVYERDESGDVRLKKEFPAPLQDDYEEKSNYSGNLLEVSYAIEEADSCSACYASLAPALLRLKEEGLYEQLLENLPGTISIGQGFTGKTGYLGVGNCCSAFERYVPGCPPDEEAVYHMLLEYIK